MKKRTIYILLGVAVALTIGVVIYKRRQKDQVTGESGRELIKP
jgi:LPXTG-motif cell wall-anchored protein